jgi:hypothetical protein
LGLVTLLGSQHQCMKRMRWVAADLVVKDAAFLSLMGKQLTEDSVRVAFTSAVGDQNMSVEEQKEYFALWLEELALEAPSDFAWLQKEGLLDNHTNEPTIGMLDLMQKVHGHRGGEL